MSLAGSAPRALSLLSSQSDRHSILVCSFLPCAMRSRSLLTQSAPSDEAPLTGQQAVGCRGKVTHSNAGRLPCTVGQAAESAISTAYGDAGKRMKSEPALPFLRLANAGLTLSNSWHRDNDVTLYEGDCRGLLADLPNGAAQLIVTSPPYNIGERCERRTALQDYLRRRNEVIGRGIDKLRPGGSVCWAIGNHVDGGGANRLDILLHPFFGRRGARRKRAA